MTRITEAALREPLREALVRRTPRRLPNAAKPSAVLLPLFERDGEVHVWLVRRPKEMRSHSGQVAFPGGKVDPDDTSILFTALRETTEEIGIPRDDIDVLGQLDDYFTVTAYTITPFVGWLRKDAVIVPNPSEVARAFAAPIATFLERPRGVAPFVGYTIEGELVWGATCSIARGLGELVASIVARVT